MSVQDYKDRTVDLVALQGELQANKLRLMDQALVTEQHGGVVATGVRKLSQRFLLVLLTPRGSMQYQEDFGTLFLEESKTWRTVADIRQSFYSALSLVVVQLQSMARDSDPPDELYASAELTDVDLNYDTASLNILLRSQAGTSVSVISPLPAPVR